MSKVIQDSPYNIKDWHFPALVMNSTCEIRYWSGYFKDYLEQEKKKALSNYEWRFLDDNRLATARFHDQSYIFLTAAIMDNGDTLMIGCSTSFLAQLQVRVTELEKINRSLDATIENSYDGIYITDQKGITLYTNSAIERITGIPKEYYLGKSVDQLIKRGILNSSVTHKVVKQRRTVSVVQESTS
ncbi:PAS domain S-box protein, partial [Peribacillus psychrosaccharolyticus]|uniref:PAS domain S-box protein n=1 Tax=Peribacillus psychrosaccharolyticus TaxID=1407 RepID=UPI000590BA2F